MAHDDALIKNIEYLAELAQLSASEQFADHSTDRNHEEMRAQYNYYYNRIYPLLKEGKINFHRLAEKTGNKERRVRETLLYRLTTGEVMQLFGKKDGYCYICSSRLFSASTKEPMCLPCLQMLDTAIQELHLADLQDAPIHRQLRQERYPEPETRVGGQSPRPEEGDWVPREQYEMLVNEVSAYRTKYGPIEFGSPVPEPSLPLPEEAAVAAPDEAPVNEVAVSDDFLDILEMNDDEIPVDQGTLNDIAGLLSDEPIRHFGFQRLKASKG